MRSRKEQFFVGTGELNMTKTDMIYLLYNIIPANNLGEKYKLVKAASTSANQKIK